MWRRSFFPRYARTGILAMLGVLVAFAPAGAQATTGNRPGQSQWDKAAARRVMMDALTRGGHRGGCHPLPAGWSTVRVIVHFPASYGGYGSWVNNAELLPASKNLHAFLKTHDPGPFMQPATGDDGQIQTNLCAPAGFTYWMVVDSGLQKVAIGRITLLRPRVSYTKTLTAPPLGQRVKRQTPSSNGTSDVASLTDEQRERTLESWQRDVPQLGIRVVAITPQLFALVRKPYVPQLHGVLIFVVRAGSAAQSIGLRPGDILTDVGNQPVSTFENLIALLNDVESSRSDFVVIRNKRVVTIPVAAGWRPPTGFVPPTTGPGFIMPPRATRQHVR